MATPIPPIPFPENIPELQDPLSDEAKPMILFPVRLETRFIPQADGLVDLCVRVYPDKIHIDSHETGLTADEVNWGKHFWEQMWRAGTDRSVASEARRKAAWAQLADRFESPRAAWIAQRLIPNNFKPDAPVQPVPDGQSPPKAPVFPNPSLKNAAWTQAPIARALPKKWTVLGYRNGQFVLRADGKPIPSSLQAGPNPNAPEVTVSPEQLALDPGLEWLVDFKVAVDKGMGIRTSMTKEAAEAGFDFLVVAGVCHEPVPGGFGPTLERLFDAHHYTHGLSFVAPGTPSNNTEDSPSGFSSKDPGHEKIYAAEFSPQVTEPTERPDWNSALLATAFWLSNDPKFFDKLPNATAKEPLEAKHMNTVLWQVSWGYFLLQMLGAGRDDDNPLDDAGIDWIREHFINHVRANGPLPTLRVGKQPYGVLPVTALKSFKQKDEWEFNDEKLWEYLRRLREVWRRNLNNVPRLGGSPDNDVDKDMAEVLSMDGISSSYSIRHLMGRHYVQHYWSFLGVDLDAHSFWKQHENQTSQFLQALRLTEKLRITHAVYSPDPAPLGSSLVQAGPIKNGDLLNPNYIESLLQARTPDDVWSRLADLNTPPSLLYFLLRHSMMLEYVHAATQLLIHKNVMDPSDRRELELVNFPGLPTRLALTPFNTRITFNPDITAGDFINGDVPPDGVATTILKRLDVFRDSLKELAKLPAARLEQLMAGTLDLCSHRLDAWITSVATKRLAYMRGPKLLGAYGWVTDLKLDAQQTQALVQPVPEGEKFPIYAAPNNPGFVHTPSLAQASTVGILRSGHLSHAAEHKKNPLEIDLSSERVRLAKWLLDGVRQGQPLGALLGYRFERRLQDANRARFIMDFRRIAPLVAHKIEATSDPAESVAANNVVDGLVLSRNWQQIQKPLPNNASPLTGLFQPPVLEKVLSDKAFLEAELDALADSVDAVADALLAEGVYQVVSGNPVSASSTLESVAAGEVPPPELDVVRTPRTGIALTHRLITLFSREPNLPDWPEPAYAHRAKAEPHLNAWVGKLLGNPARVRCVVELLDPETGNAIDNKDFRLDQLKMAPLDFLYASEVGQGGGQGEIEQRMIYAITRDEHGFAPGSRLRIRTERNFDDWDASDLSLGEFVDIIRAVRKLMSGLRAIDADDLNLPEQRQGARLVLSELTERAKKARDDLFGILETFDKALSAPETMDLEIFRDSLMHLAAFGVTDAIPVSAAGSTPANRDALIAQGMSLVEEINERLDQLTKVGGGSGTDAERDLDVGRLQAIFGKSFLVLPRFMATDTGQLGKALENSTKVQGGNPFASVTWFLQMARVREGVARLDTVLSNAETIGAPEGVSLSVAQLPTAANGEEERWVALPLVKEKPMLPGGKLSLVIQSTTDIDLDEELAGLLFDEWVEVVPNAKETTGISFQYDQPNSAPPQTILIAVPPDVHKEWTTESLQQVLLETLDLARLRAVDPDALDEVGQFLPALYLAHNNNILHAVSTDFSKLRMEL